MIQLTANKRYWDEKQERVAEYVKLATKWADHKMRGNNIAARVVISDLTKQKWIHRDILSTIESMREKGIMSTGFKNESSSQQQGEDNDPSFRYFHTLRALQNGGSGGAGS